MRMWEPKSPLSSSSARIPHMRGGASQLKTTRVICGQSFAKAKLIIFLSICSCEEEDSSWHKWSVISWEGGQAHGASSHHTPRAMSTQQRPPRPGPGPLTSGPGRFLSPCSKCTSGSYLTPVRLNFHFRGRCGFQIIYHLPKCFHMCVAFPSVQGSCPRATFSKCIKIQFGPKKFRHWCFIVVMSGNY